MKTEPKYVFCGTLADLAHVLATHIHQSEAVDGKPGTATFKVDDTPSSEEGRQMDQQELAEAFHEATGAYGVTVVNPFDQTCPAVLVGYYGGCGAVQCVTAEDSLADLEERLAAAIGNALLSNCDEGLTTDIIVEIKD